MSRVKFQRRHHNVVADILARAKLRPSDTIAECLSDLEQDFADTFKADNLSFKPGRFHQTVDRGISQDAERHLRVLRRCRSCGHAALPNEDFCEPCLWRAENGKRLQAGAR